MIPVNERPVPELERNEWRIVPRDTYVVVQTNRYPTPPDWVGNRIDVKISSDQVTLINGRQEQLSYTRLIGKFQTVKWGGTPRSLMLRKRQEGPPRLDLLYPLMDGEVEQRSLAAYESLVEEVR